MAIYIGTILRHYKKPEIQRAMVEAARGREVAVKYGEKGFGKRPDVLSYPRDVLEFAKKGASSFHVSEEHWENPLRLSAEMSKQDQDELRSGWDLVIDIDSPQIKLSKIIAWLIIKALREHDISSVSIKFSGNKGFHIGVPFEAFPKAIKKVKDEKITDQETRLWFPDGPKRIAAYLIDYITHRHMEIRNADELVMGGRFVATFDRLRELTGKSDDKLFRTLCKACGKPVKNPQKEASKNVLEFICPSCANREESSEKFLRCRKCSSLMESFDKSRSLCPCGSSQTISELDKSGIMDIDTLLISSRHMYRMPYSLHEKSGLCSFSFDPDRILDFEREWGDPDKVEVGRFRFLDASDTVEGEAAHLLVQAFDHEIAEDEIKERYTEKEIERDFEELTSAIPEDFFPPCIKNILSGLEDGRKRAMFVLINFLRCTGYEISTIEEILYRWNSNNKEQMREVNIKGQVRYRRLQKNQKVLPPNCNNKAYYKDLHICTPDSFCQRVKNPVNYAIVRAKIAQGTGAKGRQKLTEEQKAMRRQFRERMRAKQTVKMQDEKEDQPAEKIQTPEVKKEQVGPDAG